MKGAQIKTDNSYFEEKVLLRLDAIKDMNDIYVLDAFAGRGKLWDEVKKRSDKTIEVLSIEKTPKKNHKALIGDNLKYLKKLNLQKFDVIDLDSYGVPYKQFKILLDKSYSGTVIITFIQSMFGGLPIKFLNEIGYSTKMIKKIPSLFYKNGLDKFCRLLYINDIERIRGFFFNRKNYFYFVLKP